MALVNYCRKCAAEVPRGDICPRCGAKLSKASERQSFTYAVLPLRDWFSWNAALRVTLPPILLVFIVTLALEYAAGGMNGVKRLISQGFIGSVSYMLIAISALISLALILRGRESVRCAFDKYGAHMCVYIKNPNGIRLFTRMLSQSAVERLSDSPEAMPGLALIQKKDILWGDVSRVVCWRENHTLIFFRPRYWQVMAIKCPPDEYAQAEEMTRKKLSRVKGARVTPREKKRGRKR